MKRIHSSAVLLLLTTALACGGRSSLGGPSPEEEATMSGGGAPASGGVTGQGGVPASGGTSGMTCQCSGVGPTGLPITAKCGQTACGRDYLLLSCSEAGWGATGVSCAGETGGSSGGSGGTRSGGSGGSGGTRSGGSGGRGGSGGALGGSGGTTPCQCTGVSPTGAPVTARCGDSVCSTNYLWYACSSSGWSLTGLTCPVGSGGSGGSTTPTCQCSGTGPTGAPITANCGETACGKDFQLLTCAASGWATTGLTCAGSNGGSGGSAGISGKGGSAGTAGSGGKKGSGGAGGSGGSSSSCPPCVVDTVNACLPSGNCVQSTGTATQPATTCYDNGVEVQYFTIPSGDVTLVSGVVSKNGQSCYLLTVTIGSSGPAKVSLIDTHTMNTASGTVDSSGAMTVECSGKKYPLDNTCLLGSASTSCSTGTCP